jgi:putative tail fiber-related protein
MAEEKIFLDPKGLKHYNEKIKNGTIRAGRAAVAEKVAATGIQWGTELIPIANIPKAALERCVVVANDTERFKLTPDKAQNGDTVKVAATKKMFFVKDDTKLNSEAGYEPYVAGTASVAEVAESVEWNNVRNKPETFPPSNHGTNVVTSLEGFLPTSSVTNEYNRLAPDDTLNAALSKLQHNDDRVLPTMDIDDLNTFPASIAEGVKAVMGDKLVIRYTLITTKGVGSVVKPLAVGTLEQFTDSGGLTITQIAETRCNLASNATNGYYFRESQGSQRYIRHYIMKDDNPLGAKGQWTNWIPYHGEYTKKLIDAAKQEGTDAKAIATAAKNELADFRRITESEIDALISQ